MSIKTNVLNQCYCYNPYYHRINIFFFAHYLSTIFSSFSCSINDPSEWKINAPTASLYTHRYIVKWERGVSYLLTIPYNTCMCVCTSFISIPKESSALNKIVCCDDGWKKHACAFIEIEFFFHQNLRSFWHHILLIGMLNGVQEKKIQRNSKNVRFYWIYINYGFVGENKKKK